MRLATDTARVRVPATSANLGPGYDSMGLALSVFDEVSLRAVSGPTRVEVTGEGAGEVPTDDTHLVVQALRVGLDAAGAPQVGVHMRCTNAIPHARGMGSSASAIVAGLTLASQLTGGALGEADILTLATRMEGHPDNVAPAVVGGITVAWMEGENARCLRMDPPAGLTLTVAIPQSGLSTKKARALLPAQVPHADAAFTAARAALLAASLATGGGDLFAATEDRLHQDYRAEAMPATLALVRCLRAEGVPAVVSGAGPTVLVFGDLVSHQVEAARDAGFEVRALTCPAVGATTLSAQ